MDPSIDNRITIYGGNPHTLATPTAKEVITDAARRSAQVLWTPMHLIKTGMDGSTPGDTPHALRYHQANSTDIIGNTTILSAIEYSESLQVYKKRQYNIFVKSGIPKNWTLPLIKSLPLIKIFRLFSAR